MQIGIDAWNIRVGGGVTHLAEMLASATPEQVGINKVIVWGGASTLQKIEPRPWLHCVSNPLLDGNLVSRLYWQKTQIDRLAADANCSLIFVPGGSSVARFRPIVTMSQNMLLFESKESERYGYSLNRLKFWQLRRTQLSLFKKANGLIFISRYAKDTITPLIDNFTGATAVIPHGISDRFLREPIPQKPIDKYSYESPFRLVYVSMIEPYKHQWNVIEAVSILRDFGYPVCLQIVGQMGSAKAKFENSMRRFDPDGAWLTYTGFVPFEELHLVYHQADAFIYASSCENLPNILIEAMSSGLPIACSNKGPMPEVLGAAGLYFDPEKPVEIAEAVKQLLLDENLRHMKASAAYEQAQRYSWKACAKETFSFLAKVAQQA